MRPIVARETRRRQRVGRPAFALVRFVEHRDVVRRQQSAAHRQIEKEQRVIDDDEVGVLRLVALLEEEAVAKVRADLARRTRRRRRRAVPTRRRAARRPARRDRRSACARPTPTCCCIERDGATQPVGTHALELLPAEIVRAPFEQRDAQRRCRARASTSGMSLCTSCSCSAIVPGREHDLLAAADRGHEIGQRLADAGAGFDDRVHAFEDAALDELRHLQLSGTRFEAAQASRERALGAEDLLEVSRSSAGDSYSVSSSRPGAGVDDDRRDATRRHVESRSVNDETRRAVRRRGLATQSPAR